MRQPNIVFLCIISLPFERTRPIAVKPQNSPQKASHVHVLKDDHTSSSLTYQSCNVKEYESYQRAPGYEMCVDSRFMTVIMCLMAALVSLSYVHWTTAFICSIVKKEMKDQSSNCRNCSYTGHTKLIILPFKYIKILTKKHRAKPSLLSQKAPTKRVHELPYFSLDDIEDYSS